MKVKEESEKVGLKCKIQIAWNMPVAIGCDSSAAADAVEMVAMQNEMEAAAPEYTAPDRMSIN